MIHSIMTGIFLNIKFEPKQDVMYMNDMNMFQTPDIPHLYVENAYNQQVNVTHTPKNDI